MNLEIFILTMLSHQRVRVLKIEVTRRVTKPCMLVWDATRCHGQSGAAVATQTKGVVMGGHVLRPVVLVADPPWRFGDKLPGKSRGAAKHYRVMGVEQIAKCPLPIAVQCAPVAVLFLWRVSAMLEEALIVARAWGFQYHSELVWEKLTKTGKRHFGMGRIVRGAHESCIIATRGRAWPAVRNERSIFSAPVGLHSEKPDAFYAQVERMYPGSERYEMFARRTRPGWHQLGNQVGKLDGHPVVELVMPRVEDPVAARRAIAAAG